MKSRKFLNNLATLNPVLLLVWMLQFAQSSFAGVSQPAPGGVSSNLRLWLKADAGITGTTPITA